MSGDNDEEENRVKDTLKEWASAGRLAQASLGDDALVLADVSLPRALPLTVEWNGKTCRYSCASIYLQIVHPGQLLAYRNACKEHAVSDPVKALDKKTVVGYFLGESSSAPPPPAAEPEPMAVEPESAAVTQEDTPAAATTASQPEAEAPRPKEKSRKHDKHRKDKRSKDHRKDESPSKKKKTKSSSLVTNEQLFEHLNVVVDKRQVDQSADQQDAITAALSTEGFNITPQLLEEYKEESLALLANEIPVGNSASILRANNPRKDFTRVLELFVETVNPSKKKSSSSSSSALKPGSPTKKQVKTHLVGKKPIILVPKGMTAPLTLLNAHEFLSNARFVPRDAWLKQGNNQKPKTTFTRTVRGSTGTTGLVEYEILDNPRKLGPSEKEWDRIVAVVVLGQSWQFKDWLQKYNAPATLFDKAFGFFVNMQGDKIPPEVPNWAVTTAVLNRDKRGMDRVTFASFWNGLDEWMRVHKPELLPQGESS